MFGSLAFARTQSTKPRIRTMSFSMSQASLPVFEIDLNALSAILDKAEAYAAAKKIDPSVLLHSRLSPDMFALVRQVQIAADQAKNGSARLGGVEAPRYEDNETTTDQLKARLAKTVAYLKTLDRKQIDASADREITFPLGPTNKGHMKGDDYLELLFPCHSRLRDPASLRRGHRQARLFGCDPHEANLRQPGRRGLPPRSCAEGYRHPADALAAISP